MKRLNILFITLFIFIFFNPITSWATTNVNNKKVVILVMDYIDTKDLIVANTPNLDELVERSGTSLMNIRAKNRYPSSSYMSIAVGYRVGTINNSELSFNIDEYINTLPNVFEITDSSLTAKDLYSLFSGTVPPDGSIVNLYTENINKNSLLYNPSYEIGQIGKIARDNNILITVLGNADTVGVLSRNVAILGIDEKGIIPQGDISRNVTIYDPLVAGGMKSNHDVLIEKFRKFLPSSRLLIIDLGDTTRVEMSRFATADNIVLKQRQQAIERNDELIGRILQEIDLNHTMLLIITPNPHKEMVNSNNFGLTPIIIYEPNQSQGLLTSSTTRRPGLITNLDIIPTIFNFLEADFIASGNKAYINKVGTNSIEILDDNLQLYQNLRVSRNPLHILFISLILFTILFGLLVNRSENKKAYYYKLLNILIYSILSIPIIWMFISVTNYESIIFSFFITIFFSLLISILLHLFFKPVTAILIITGITSLFLTIDCFNSSRLMLLSPLGSDAIAGGRYYGVGNDFMGILLASSVVFITLFLHRFNFKNYVKALLGFIFLLIVSIAIGHPRFGANVGGLITALVTTGVFVLIISNRKINLKMFTILGVLAVLGVIGVAELDYLFSQNPSHAGKAINSLLTGGYQVFFSIIRTKLGILVNTVYTSNWSIVMLVTVILFIYIWLKDKEKLALLAIKNPSIMNSIRILIISGVTVFVVNDTGVIAAALIFTYILACLGLGLGEN